MRALVASTAAMFLALGGCAQVDSQGNERPPGPGAQVLLGQVHRYTASSQAELVSYCAKYSGAITSDRRGCAVLTQLTLEEGYPCTLVTQRGASPLSSSDTRFLTAVCDGWWPALAQSYAATGHRSLR